MPEVEPNPASPVEAVVVVVAAPNKLLLAVEPNRLVDCVWPKRLPEVAAGVDVPKPVKPVAGLF